MGALSRHHSGSSPSSQPAAATPPRSYGSRIPDESTVLNIALEHGTFFNEQKEVVSGRRDRPVSCVPLYMKSPKGTSEMASYLWRMYADRVHSRWEKTFLWDMIEPYRRPKSFVPLVKIYIAAFYTGVIGAAITEQLYKEKYWEDHPGEAVPLMRPRFYYGPWKINRGDVLPPNQ